MENIDLQEQSYGAHGRMKASTDIANNMYIQLAVSNC